MPAACQIDILSRSRADSILSAMGYVGAFLPMGEVGNLIPIVKAPGVVTGAIEMPAVERGTCACHRHLIASVRSIYRSPCIGSDIITEHVGGEPCPEAVNAVDFVAFGVGDGSHGVGIGVRCQLRPRGVCHRECPPVLQVCCCLIGTAIEAQPDIDSLSHGFRYAIHTGMNRSIAHFLPLVLLRAICPYVVA